MLDLIAVYLRVKQAKEFQPSAQIYRHGRANFIAIR